MTNSNEAVEAAVRTMPEYTPEDEADSFEREANEQCRAKVERILEAAAPFIRADAGAKALEDAAEEFESNVGVSEFSDQSVRDDCRWGHIEEAWEYQGPYMDWLRNRAAAVRGEG